MNIKGEYEFNITIQNMFNTYNIVTKNHNIVTRDGLSLFLKCAINNSEDFFGEVYVGKNSTPPSINDTTAIFLQEVPLPHEKLEVNDNQIIYTINTTGSKINGTTEIGVWSDNAQNKTLISRDVHEPYDLPSDAIITLKYTFTLTNDETTELNEE